MVSPSSRAASSKDASTVGTYKDAEYVRSVVVKLTKRGSNKTDASAAHLAMTKILNSLVKFIRTNGTDKQHRMVATKISTLVNMHKDQIPLGLVPFMRDRAKLIKDRDLAFYDELMAIPFVGSSLPLAVIVKSASDSEADIIWAHIDALVALVPYSSYRNAKMPI